MTGLLRAGLADGTELHYIERGSGPTLLLLHGGMGDCRSWQPQIEGFARRFRVIAFSRRHSSPNRNPPAANHSIETDADDLLRFEALLGIGSAHLVGTSYGALVALAHALHHPARVLSLVLAEPPLHRWACRTREGAALYAAFMTDVWQRAAAAFDGDDDRQALQLLVDGMWGRPTFGSLSPARRDAALRNAGAMRALTRAVDPFPDLARDAVAGIAHRVLLLHGSHASALHVRVIEELARVLPRAAIAVIDGAGHASPAENPDGFNAAVLRFLSGD